MRKVFITGLFILQIFLLSASGQTEDAPGCASEHGKKLGFLIGKWKVKSRFRTGSDPDKWEETKGKSKIRFLFDECLAEEKLEIRRGGRPLTVVALYSYNNVSDRYQWIFAHSEHGLLTLYEGALNENTFTLKSSTEVRGRTVLFERILKKTADGFELNARRSTDDGKTWRDDWFLTYYR